MDACMGDVSWIPHPPYGEHAIALIIEGLLETPGMGAEMMKCEQSIDCLFIRTDISPEMS